MRDEHPLGSENEAQVNMIGAKPGHGGEPASGDATGGKAPVPQQAPAGGAPPAGGGGPGDNAGGNGERSLDILFQDGEPALADALKDLVMLSGVLKDLAAERFWHRPGQVLDTLRCFELIRRGTFYEEESVQGEEELVYRFQREHGNAATIDIPRLVRLCRRYNWVTAAGNPPLRLTSTGRRMVGQLFRFANDSLYYYRQAPPVREIYQAERDLQLARAYEDVGVGRNDTVASVLHNLENAVNDLRLQREKYVQDRQALERYEAVLALVEMLETELERRLKEARETVGLKLERQNRRSATLFYRVIKELSALLGENAYVSQLRVGRRVARVDREKFLQYLVDVYGGSMQALANSPLQVMRNMEQGVYDSGEEEELEAGIWLPFHLPFYISQADIEKGGNLLARWAEKWEPPAPEEGFAAVEYREARVVSQRELAGIVGRSTSITEEIATDTRPMVEAVRDNPGESVAGLVNLLAGGWGDAVRQLFVLGFLVNAGEARTFEHPESDRREKKRALRWKVGYPGGRVRYVKGTASLGRHLER